ncbi:16S rRNA (cytidine(1402)-2'-O)-methyltransferase [Methylomicrobium sp. Wu6]|uniref:16S rRNA (cytidine(1402)-2'-O)-methyltransferase n=1 Tax=Methylomicrobium sp. Wu6 TaxID=3107928 RepID=UPI002DD6251B|nr:16S rRNA (cytidine(1402)-2'-O)-methyltransferase [Methylomicrobium sp. Wu6]MEC4748985.1 16S rRNA (cytidine(1402)-2'-O)-methyltransferase [Methylomicrobium sp. Wu6]
MMNERGKLYVVATPIGNLGDISYRAVETLRQVDLIAAEDTRHIKTLLQHYGINQKVISLHQHNEERASAELLEKLRAGLSIALVSDAGTPLVSDPGMPLVRMVKEAGIEVSPLPGACALIAALSAAGLPTARFSFEGFAPRASAERKSFFKAKAASPDTWIFYESCHRVLASLRDLSETMLPDRQVVIARELTKLHETIVKTSLAEALVLVESDHNMQKGEFVIIVEGAPKGVHPVEITDEQEKILRILLKECSISTAVALAVQLTGARKKALYPAALVLGSAKSE